MKKLNITAIKIKMEKLGLNQSNLADSLGISRESVSQWLKNAKMPRPAYLLKLATILQMSFSEIVLKEEDAIGSFAYRTHKKVKTDEYRAENATIVMEYLHEIFKDAEPSSLLSIPNLKEPSNQYAYIQKAVASFRKILNLTQDQIVTPKHILNYMQSFPIVFIPVLWGEKGDQALVIHLQKLQVFCLYLNVETKVYDFTFWLLHELAHILTPGLVKEEAELFADSFAGALLFPEPCVQALFERISPISNVGIKITMILEEAKMRSVAPICIFKEINGFLTKNGMPVLDFDIYGASTNYLRSVPLLSDVLFEAKRPPAQKYIEVTSEYFGSDFWDALSTWVIENNKTSSAVQTVLNIPLSDAKEVWAYLNKKEIPT